MNVNKETCNKIEELVFDANFILKKAKVLQGELTGDFFMQLELKSFNEVSEYGYVENYNRSSMFAHITGDYLEQLEKTLKELSDLLIAEKKQTKEKADAPTSTEEI